MHRDFIWPIEHKCHPNFLFPEPSEEARVPAGQQIVCVKSWGPATVVGPPQEQHLVAGHWVVETSPGYIDLVAVKGQARLLGDLSGSEVGRVVEGVKASVVEAP